MARANGRDCSKDDIYFLPMGRADRTGTTVFTCASYVTRRFDPIIQQCEWRSRIGEAIMNPRTHTDIKNIDTRCSKQL